MKKLYGVPLGATFCLVSSLAVAQDSSLDSLIARHAAKNNIPESMVHRIVKRESNYNPRAVGGGGALGLMQIKQATARGMGYAGPATGLLDADTNLTYAVRYLAGAYRLAGGDPAPGTVSCYAAGYYYVAKRRGITMAAVQTPGKPEPGETAKAEAGRVEGDELHRSARGPARLRAGNQPGRASLDRLLNERCLVPSACARASSKAAPFAGEERPRGGRR